MHTLVTWALVSVASKYLELSSSQGDCDLNHMFELSSRGQYITSIMLQDPNAYTYVRSSPSAFSKYSLSPSQRRDSLFGRSLTSRSVKGVWFVSLEHRCLSFDHQTYDT